MRRIARTASLIEFVADRPGHDLRYAIDAGKVRQELGWTPRETLATGIAAHRGLVSRQSRLVRRRFARAATMASGSGSVKAAGSAR